MKRISEEPVAVCGSRLPAVIHGRSLSTPLVKERIGDAILASSLIGCPIGIDPGGARSGEPYRAFVRNPLQTHKLQAMCCFQREWRIHASYKSSGSKQKAKQQRGAMTETPSNEMLCYRGPHSRPATILLVEDEAARKHIRKPFTVHSLLARVADALAARRNDRNAGRVNGRGRLPTQWLVVSG